MLCQCGGTGKGIKSKVGGELELSLQALLTYLCDLCAFKCAISPLIFNISPLIFNSINQQEDYKGCMLQMLQNYGLQQLTRP